MSSHPFQIYRCPSDLGRLSLFQGFLECETCHSRYPIENKIPDFLPKDLNDIDRKYLEQRDREISIKSWDYGSPTRTPLEVSYLIGNLNAAKGQLILDIACGKGRISAELLRIVPVHLVGVDFHINALKAFYNRVQHNTHIQLARANAAQLPFADKTFDGAICSELLTNILQDELVEQILSSAVRVLKPGATFVLTTFNHGTTAQRMGYPKVGFFPETNIPCRFFTFNELKQLLACHFVVKDITPINCTIPKLTGALNCLGSIGHYLSAKLDFIARRLPNAASRGEVLAVKCIAR
jgi:SAM-dependent methyltransferase